MIPIALNTFREIIRNRVLYSVVALAALLVAGSALFGSVTIGDQAQVVKDFGVFCLSFFGAAISILSGVNLLNKELHQKTVFNILSKPVERWEFVVGKFLGLSLTSMVLVSLMGFLLVAFAALFDHRLDLLLFQAIYFTALETVVISAITIFFSSMAVTIVLPGILTFATYICGHSLEYLRFFVEEEPVSPVLRRVVSLLHQVLPDLSLLNVADTIASGNHITLPQALFMTGYAVAYSVVLVVLGAFIFQRRELL